MAARKKKKTTIKLATTKLPGESEQQYVAWLLYCDSGSIDKLLHLWEGLHQGFTETSPEFIGLRSRLGDLVSRRTLASWSKKFQWVKRRDMKLAEDLTALREETQRIATTRKHKVAEAFKRSIDLKIKQLRKGEAVSTSDVKALWEMLRTELGLSTGKTEISHKINEDDQVPPTPEEDELGKEIDQAIKNFYDKKRRTPEN
jgi:hypothetical protein